MQIPFIGPSYVGPSLNVDAQRSVNLYPEVVESKDGKNTYCLIGTPGLDLFVALPTFPIRGQWAVLGRLFVVSGNQLYEVYHDGTYDVRGTLLSSNSYVSISDNTSQLCIVDGDNEYIFTFATNAFQVNPAIRAFLGSNVVAFINGYFVFAERVSRKFYFTSLNDGTVIGDLDFANKEGASDNISGIINFNRQLFIMGTKTSEIWDNTGNNDLPFSPVPGIFIETGSPAYATIKKFDNSFAWLGSDERGQGIVYKLQGYVPVRISTHAIERIIKSWGDLVDCVSYSYQEDGHTFYALNHPEAKTTLVYDSATDAWHERQYYNSGTGELTRHRVSFYASIFNKHVMGDYDNGNLYVSSLTTYTDNGQSIHRIRAAPHIFSDLKRIFFSFFQVDMETGVGIDGTGQGEDPQMMLRYSKDGGNTWSRERWKTCGRIGKKKHRVFWTRLGVARDMVFEVKITDPVKVVLINATTDATQGKS